MKTKLLIVVVLTTICVRPLVACDLCAIYSAISGESKGKDTFAGVADNDSAETVVYMGPVLSFTWSENFSGHIGADLPVSRSNSGEQLMPDYRIHAAMMWMF